MAVFEVALLELTLYLISIIAILIAMLKMRGFKYDKKVGKLNYVISKKQVEFPISILNQRKNR